jgi:hypothetical protein
MTLSRRTLCILYALLALAALIGCWSNNLQYKRLGFFASNVHFWEETFANPASRSITVDLMFLTLAAVSWMVLEARRLRMPQVWIYVLVGILIAISVSFPAFLIHRQRALARSEGSANAGVLSPADTVGLSLIAAVALTYALVTLRSS